MASQQQPEATTGTRGGAARPKLPLRGFAHVDALRALAVMLVVVSHTRFAESFGQDVNDEFFVVGGSGVTLFFVLSGFIITHLMIREHEKTGGFDVAGFYGRRALKIFPPLLAVVLIPTVVYAALTHVNWNDVLSQVFFGFNWVYMSKDVSVLPGSMVTWSLSIEEQFYLAAALLWVVLARGPRPEQGLRILAWAIVVGSLTARVALHLNGADTQRIYYGTDTRVDGIAIGILVALWLRNRRVADRRAANLELSPRSRGLARAHRARAQRWGAVLGSDAALLLAVSAFVASLLVDQEVFRAAGQYTVQAAAVALVVMWGLVGPHGPVGRAVMAGMASRPVQLLGLASYSIYLVNLILVEALRPWLLPMPTPVSMALTIAVTTTAGLLVWRGVEEPVAAWRRRRKARARQSAQLQPATA